MAGFHVEEVFPIDDPNQPPITVVPAGPGNFLVQGQFTPEEWDGIFRWKVEEKRREVGLHLPIWAEGEAAARLDRQIYVGTHELIEKRGQAIAVINLAQARLIICGRDDLLQLFAEDESLWQLMESNCRRMWREQFGSLKPKDPTNLMLDVSWLPEPLICQYGVVKRFNQQVGDLHYTLGPKGPPG